MDVFRPRIFLLLSVALMPLSACTVIQRDPEPEPLPIVVPPEPPPALAGTIYQPGYGLRLFTDPKAGRVGDILTIRLIERTAATKSAQTGTSKDTSVDTGMPIIAGDTVTLNGNDILENRWEGSSSFKGGGSSSQSNKLDGEISVTITRVYPNGNLHVSGDKWITLNQGREFVRITGVVRHQDILPDNTVESSRVADAQIIYSGKGSLAEANQVGWLSRFFMSPLWPM
ncbi:MAG: flagellar basal body L-ring protein FlgH [Gammaproteobacteria bacterium]